MRKAITITLFFMLIFLLSPFVATVDDGEGFAHLPSSDSTAGSGASEEENIDSFDVSPNSGRWNVTNDNQTDDLVTDSILRMTTVNNATSDDITDPVGFNMDRGMRKTDGKVEYRMAASGGGNQTEYSRDVIGDKWDFEEGDVDGWSDGGGFVDTLTISNGILIIDMLIAGDWGVIDLTIDPNITAEIYHTYKIKVKSEAAENTNIAIWDDIFGTVYQTTTDLTDEWQEFEFIVGDDADWTGIITNPVIRFFTDAGNFDSTNDEFEIEFIELTGNLDFATHIENEVEDTWDWEVDNSTESWTGAEAVNVSEGLLRTTMKAGDATDFFNGPVAILFMDTNLFTILQIRINTSSSIKITPFGRQADNTLVQIGTEEILDSSILTVFEWDLSIDSDWTDVESFRRLHFQFADDSGNFEGDEIVFIDYVLLLGHWADSDSVIGLWDQDDLVPLLNVSSHFTSNNSHPTTSDNAYFTVELIDLDGDVAYLAQSDNFTDISDLWIQGKITYDVLRSKLSVTINADNLTRIDKWTFPGDFTEVSGRIPALFSHTKSPYVFTSTFCVATSWQEMKLDYIRAPFKEREWTQTSSPVDANWITDTIYYCSADDDLDEASTYQIVVPYLDIVSGILSMNVTRPANIVAGDEAWVEFVLYAVDATTGTKSWMYDFRIEMQDHGGSFGYEYYIEERNTGAVYGGTKTSNDQLPIIELTLRMVDDRSKVEVYGYFKYDKDSDTERENTFGMNSTVANTPNINTPSDEFVLVVNHYMNFDGNIHAKTYFNEFSFIERARFAEKGKGLPRPEGESNNWLVQILVELGRWITSAFAFVMEPLFATLGIIIVTMQTALTAAINQIQGWLTTLGTTITTAINQIQDWLTALGTTITTAINQIEGWLTAIATTISNAIGEIEGWLTAIASTISDAIAEIAADIWTAFGTVAGSIMDDIITALTALASDVADFLDAMIQFLIPLLLAIAADLAGLIVEIIDALLTIGGDILAGIINFAAGIIFFIWEELGLPDILAVIDLFISPIIEIVTGLPTYITDIGDLIAVFFIVILGIYWFWLIFLAFAEKGFDIFAGFGESVSRLFTFWNLTFFGIGPIPIPIALFFIPLTYFMILPSGSVFAIW